jgi:hypothetical protein
VGSIVKTAAARPSVNLPDRTPDGIDSGQSERRHRGLARRARSRASACGPAGRLGDRAMSPRSSGDEAGASPVEFCALLPIFLGL